jgi:hypothetical protein
MATLLLRSRLPLVIAIVAVAATLICIAAGPFEFLPQSLFRSSSRDHLTRGRAAHHDAPTEELLERRRLDVAMSSASCTSAVLASGNASEPALQQHGAKKSTSSSALVTCHRLLQDVHGDPNAGLNRKRQREQYDPNDGQLYARYTKLVPQFWISLHSFEYDPVRYGTLHWGNYYEHKLSEALTQVLSTYNQKKQTSCPRIIKRRRRHW